MVFDCYISWISVVGLGLIKSLAHTKAKIKTNIKGARAEQPLVGREEYKLYLGAIWDYDPSALISRINGR